MVIMIAWVGVAVATAGGAEDVNQIQIEPAEIHRFVVSLHELRERNQSKHLNEAEIKEVAGILGVAKFQRSYSELDVARSAYISRFSITHGYLGGTRNTGKSRHGLLTMDARAVYWGGSIYTVTEADAARLLAIFPKPINPLTVSELPGHDS